MTRQAKPFAHLKPKTGETKAQALIRLGDFSRFGIMAQLLIMEALGRKFGAIEYGPRDTNMGKLKQFLKAAPNDTVAAVEEYAGAVAAMGLEKVREQFKGGAGALIHPDSWHGVAVEIKTALDAAKA
ncbi:hypothetical protein HOU00_gp105 [Caulobacter phage CcrPW]|uniref:Uncharacterized protein n=1 Tax=Caulobacter phage CcrPW TaxID=2283271 RepID=A0A385EBJ0_9CAUD|nr:hypothetical protein HOU00_gp032 [Caulobacter phage CcrPW]YP_009809650.1 hypothetical protein HOU00_gp105 [Caulobacter phage CcrPW]AXQ68571.1 hypothetical protein CcrPW_gp032 [Caulobacter phage CcrPW]AXQ69020.1 hypothetical protein CcrPW_gp481 [Caulobacter phage CcrPW]